jgi:hypothetical protein
VRGFTAQERFLVLHVEMAAHLEQWGAAAEEYQASTRKRALEIDEAR